MISSTKIDFESTNFLNRFESQQQQQPIWRMKGAATEIDYLSNIE
jgi:hypothetical protein